MTIGEKIQSIRKKQKITQQELAEKCGCSVISIGRYENGERTPSIEIVAKIANTLQVPLTDLVDGVLPEEQIRFLKDTIVQADTTIEKASMEVASADSIMRYFNKLNYSGRRKLIQYAIDLSKIEEYTNWEKDKFLNNGQSFGTESAKGDTE